MTAAILALNAGSSSIKFGLFEVNNTAVQRSVAHGEIEGIGGSPHFLARAADHTIIGERCWEGGPSLDHEALLGGLLEWVDAHLRSDTLIAVGHRVVHGGRDFTEPVPLDEEVLRKLELLAPLAPLHQLHSLSPVRAILTLRPELAQVACFDTAFHQTLSALTTRFALPQSYESEGVRRYGFHGLSYEYIAGTLREVAPKVAAGRVIVAHLGNGASLCAMSDGRSVDTTMGFTALDGLMMGTRCGTIDPGVILYMLQHQKLRASEIEEILYKRSGLLGVSGISSDMRELLGSAEADARKAIELFVFRIAREAAALVGSLGGLDGFVFTAGVGEHAPEIRSAVCERMAWLGVVIDASANIRHASRISTPDSLVDVRVIGTNEEAIIARHTLQQFSRGQRVPV
jgi:acetate kinase